MPPDSGAALPLGDASRTVSPDVLKRIKNAWVAALICAGATLALTLLAAFGIVLLGFDAWNFLDVAFILGLAYGIYRKSRVCAVLMFAYYLVSRIMLIVETGKPIGIVVSVIFLYYYALGIAGTVAYHKHIQQTAP